MANEDQLRLLRQGVEAWNKWIMENPHVEIDLSRANLHGAVLSDAVLSDADLSDANLSRANLYKANLREANLSRANLSDADLRMADLELAYLRNANLRNANLWQTYLWGDDLSDANLSDADLRMADLNKANLRNANLRKAILSQANLSDADLCGANLSDANLRMADLIRTDLTDTDLTAADLSGTSLIETTLVRTKLTGCRVYGISAWGLRLDETEQKDLIITPENQPTVTVDNIEVAQFVYLLLHNKKIRQVIDTITSKVILILGRFTPERKAVLDAIRDELRKRGYVPVLFDFDKPDSRDITETVTTLARLARFIIADITDPKSIPLELQAIIPNLAVPVQPLLLEGSSEFSMFRDLRRKYHWVLQVHIYKDPTDLFSSFEEKVIAPAVAKAIELRDDKT